MNNDNNLVQLQDENGNTLNMLILNEFDYKSKKYAILMEMKTCFCDDECDNEGHECNCEHNDCNCGHNDCNCEHDNCENEDAVMCLLEITKDEKGNEIFKSIDDEKLFDEVVKEADKLYL